MTPRRSPEETQALLRYVDCQVAITSMERHMPDSPILEVARGLLPGWKGSAQELLEAARDCVATDS